MLNDLHFSCTDDENLVGDDFDNEASPNGLTKRIWTIMYVFKFYNSDSIYIECVVKVCPSSSSHCDLVSIS